MRGITSNTFIKKAMWDQLSDIITFTNLLPIFKFANISWCYFAWSYDNSDKEPPKNMNCRRCSVRSTVSAVSRSVNNLSWTQESEVETIYVQQLDPVSWYMTTDDDDGRRRRTTDDGRRRTDGRRRRTDDDLTKKARSYLFFKWFINDCSDFFS